MLTLDIESKDERRAIFLIYNANTSNQKNIGVNLDLIVDTSIISS